MADYLQMTFDIVIVGGGLSGLALAAELARPVFSTLKILVLEQRPHYLRDRTWSYWRTAQDAHRYSHLERHQWHSWRVRQSQPGDINQPDSVTKNGKAHTYCSLDGDQFYAAAQHTITQSSHVILRLGVAVRQIVGGVTPRVKTVDGAVIYATWIFDARPPMQNNPQRLVQQFVGIEIKTVGDVFDPTTVELMHFHPSPDGLHFFYVLPYSSTNALVETTWISPASLKPDFDAELKRFITHSLGVVDFEVVYQESGSLNLSDSHSTSDNNKHVVPLGRGAGTLRASTGYAFLETLHHVEKIAASLERHLVTGKLEQWTPTTFRRSNVDRWMDGIFLKVLERDWATSSRYFMQLFERLDGDSMVAFLNGKANLRQRLSVTCVLPTYPFMAQTISTLIHATPNFFRGWR